MHESREKTPSLNDYIRRLNKLQYNGVSITILHKMRGIIGGNVYSEKNERYALGQGEGGVWSNVAEHGAVGMIVADVLGEAFSLSTQERGELNLAVWLQDSGKKTERIWQKMFYAQGDEFKNLVEEENIAILNWPERQQKMLDNVAAMEEEENALAGLGSPRIQELMRADIPKSEKGHGDDLAAKISWFTDAILTGPHIVGVTERFDALERDVPGYKMNLFFSESFRHKYEGKTLYEVQRSVGAEYEAEFSKRLGIEQSQLYPWLRRRVEARIRSQKMPVMPIV